ncbi:MAG: DNA polymerase IV, partial [Flavobacteriales bacterium]
QNFGKSGRHYFEIVRLQDNRSVNPNRIRKSIGVEHTYSDDIYDLRVINNKLDDLAFELARRMKKSSAKGKTVTVKIKFNDFTQTTKSMTFRYYVSQTDNLKDSWKLILGNQFELPKPVRLLGLSVTSLKRNEIEKRKNPQLKLKF